MPFQKSGKSTGTNVISDEMQTFITSHIDSIAELEGLLLLRQDSSIVWDPFKLSERLYISVDDANHLVHNLCNRGFLAKVQEPPGYIYQPHTNELDSKVTALAEAYSKYLVPITNLVHSRPKTKIQQLADAFWIRKE